MNMRNHKGRKSFIVIILGIFMIFFILASCGKDEQTDSLQNVYIAGAGASQQGSPNTFAKLWKNGKTQILPTTGSQAFAKSVFVSGDDVYVAGFALNLQNKYVAMVWKNGIPQNLTNGIYSGYATTVYVYEGDVYVAGWEYFEEYSYSSIARLWKNGVSQNLQDSLAYNGGAEGVFVSGGDVYIAGSKIWKNSKVLYNFSASAIFVSNNDVYVVGCDTWKNGEILYNNGGHSIFVQGNDVYVTGCAILNGKEIATLWKNGVAQYLTDGTNDACAESVYVSGNDVYVVGHEDNYGLKLWKNGVSQEFPNRELWKSEYSCLFVK